MKPYLTEEDFDFVGRNVYAIIYTSLKQSIWNSVEDCIYNLTYVLVKSPVDVIVINSLWSLVRKHLEYSQRTQV